MFGQNTPAFPIVAIAAYLMSVLWLVPVQALTLRRLAPDSRGLDRLTVVIAGEAIALLAGGLLIAALIAAAAAFAAFMSASQSVLDAIQVANLRTPWVALPVLLIWLGLWGTISAGVKALLLRWMWPHPPPPRGRWDAAWRMTFRGYAATAVATVLVVIGSCFG